MLSRRFQERVSSARAVGVGALRGYELRWHKASKDDSGKCDVVQSSIAQDVVFGVLYELNSAEKPQLDAAEGLGHGYAEKQVVVETETGLVTAWTYYATDISFDLVPYTWYKALVVAGAKEHGLPPPYISKLEAVPAKTDTDAKRAARNFSMANAANHPSSGPTPACDLRGPLI